MLELFISQETEAKAFKYLTQSMSYQTSKGLLSMVHRSLISPDAPFPIRKEDKRRLCFKELNDNVNKLFIKVTNVWPPDSATISLSVRPIRLKTSLKCDASAITGLLIV